MTEMCTVKILKSSEVRQSAILLNDIIRQRGTV